jgi:hypothetical protein
MAQNLVMEDRVVVEGDRESSLTTTDLFLFVTPFPRPPLLKESPAPGAGRSRLGVAASDAVEPTAKRRGLEGAAEGVSLRWLRGAGRASTASPEGHIVCAAAGRSGLA